ncbi:amidohydrolase family protein (plasmid) [Nicoliella spurrieriana]|uniref:Amidohydrolase family protein n=1 Tax=Nicoliella spurrieriana TaxID=2925830 RepID=A0A976RQR6_9LACO|nr:amidohydrolase family protein [Nicoliella spurrieriana]UQS86135.1 amidohydrolase family protein [Nicoliella spurrieriana]
MSKTLFVNVNLFNGKDNKVTADSWMLVDEETGKFVDMGTGQKHPNADTTMDLHQQYVMPGLVNCHTHVTLDSNAFDGAPQADQTETAVRAVENLKTLLKSGVTYVRECGSTYGLDTTLARMQREGKLKKVPEVMAAGRAMTMTGGHGDYPDGGKTVDSPDEMRKAVRENFKNGAQSTKVMATGGVMSPGDYMDEPQLTVEELRVAVEETHHKHAVVAAHAEGNPGIMNALLAGVDSIEHGFYVNDEEVEMMLKHHTYLTPTIVSAWCIAEYGQNTLPKWELDKLNNALSDLYHNVHNAYAKGVHVTLGTDAGTPYNDFAKTPKEFELLVEKEGFSNFDALSTSRHSAELMQLDDYGTLEPGKYADFLVLDHDPLADVKAVQQLDKNVYKHGHKEY